MEARRRGLDFVRVIVGLRSFLCPGWNRGVALKRRDVRFGHGGHASHVTRRIRRELVKPNRLGRRTAHRVGVLRVASWDAQLRDVILGDGHRVPQRCWRVSAVHQVQRDTSLGSRPLRD